MREVSPVVLKMSISKVIAIALLIVSEIYTNQEHSLPMTIASTEGVKTGRTMV